MSEQVSMTAEEILAIANELAECDDDMTEATLGGGGFNRRLPVGWSVARLTRYTEKGKHVELFQGKAKDPELAFTLGFELFSPAYLNEDGTPYTIETFDISKTRNEKSRAFKLFKAMNYKGLSKNFAQLLGRDVFLVEIKDHLSKTAPAGSEPRSVVGEVRAGIDVVTGQEYACPAAKALFLFSWAKPTLAGWDSFFIEGTNDKTGKSKNWQQEKIAGATDFKGSALEALLLTNGRPIPVGTPQKTGVNAAPAGAQPAGAVPAAVPAPTQPVTPATPPAAAAVPAATVPVAAVPVVATPAVAVPLAPAVPSIPSVPAAVAPAV